MAGMQGDFDAAAPLSTRDICEIAGVFARLER
jgi:hypothetical protein